MKKTLIVGLALGIALTATSAFALTDVNVSNNNGLGAIDQTQNRDGNYGGNGIVGSSHDLSGVTGAGGGSAADAKQRICIYCHHPHHAFKPGDLDSNTETQYSPLWNRVTPAEGTFIAYNNGVMMGTTDPAGGVSATRHYMNGSVAIAGVSMLCMSCHDGTTAMNAYSTGSGSDNGNANSTGAALLDKAGLANYGSSVDDMSNHHPVGMDWDAVHAVDDEIADKSAIFGDAYGAILESGSQAGEGDNPDGVTIDSVLYKGKMECVTCHDVHNTQNEVGAERFLWISNNGSRFCLTCHLK